MPSVNRLDKILNFQNISMIENLKTLFLDKKYGYKKHWSKEHRGS